MKKTLLKIILIIGLNSNLYADTPWNEAFIEFDIKKAEKLLAQDITMYGEKSNEVAIAYNILGLILNAKKDYSNAITYFNKSLKITKNIQIDKQDLDTMEVSYQNLGAAYFGLKEYKNALTNYKKVLKYRKNPKSINHDKIWMVLTNIAQTHFKLENFGKSREYYLKAYENTSKLANRMQIFILLAELSEKSKDYKTAIICYSALSSMANTFENKTPEVIQGIAEWDTRAKELQKLLKKNK